MAKAKVTPEFLQKLKDKVNIIEIVGEHVVLRKTGANYVGLCPFHSERSPSFSVNEQKQLYHCYGCKKGGDLVSFVMEIHNISFPEAIEELADRAKIALPQDYAGKDANEDPEVAKRREAAREKMALAYKLNRFAAAFFHQSLPKQPHIEQYFESRGVKGELARNFYVGAAPASWEALSNHLVAKKAPTALAVELGLVKPSTKNEQGFFDLFRNRAMFPILDMRGKVAGFGGRALPTPPGAPDIGGDTQPKYLNSPESLLFQKGKLAYGLYQAQKHIRERDEVILVEGYFDVLALHAAGFGNVVATCGTALTPDHLTLFKRLASKVTVLFDGDKAGITATERAMEVGLDHGIVLYGAVVTAGLDPDELLFDQMTGQPTADGVAKMTAILAEAKPLLDARIELEVKKALEGPEALTQSLKQIASWLVKFKDPVGREIRVAALQKQLGVSRQLIDQVMGVKPGSGAQSQPAGRPGPGGQNHPYAPSSQSHPAGRRPNGPPALPQARPQPARKPKPLSAFEKVILTAIARGGDYAEIILQGRRNLPPKMTFSDFFEHPSARLFADSLVSDPGNFERFRQTPEIFLQGEIDPAVKAILTEALVSSDPGFEKSDLKHALDRAVARAWARFSQHIKRALADAEAKKDAGLQAELMKEYLDVQRKMKEFNRFYDEA